MVKCPICEEHLYDLDGELICQGGCGSSFSLEYLVYYTEGSNNRVEAGFEKQGWKEKWGKILIKWKNTN